MSSLAALKALVTVSALGFGVSAVVLVVGMQRDPYMFTNMGPRTPAPAAREATPVAPPAAFELTPPAAIAEPLPATSVPALKKAVEKSAPAALTLQPRKSRVQTETKAPADDPSVDRVIPAPCIDGEYRQLDEHRGVRLMCPGAP